MKQSDSWQHVVHTHKGVDDRESRMQSWCEQECEGLWCALYVSWNQEAWAFTDAEDELRFRLTWHDYVAHESHA